MKLAEALLVRANLRRDIHDLTQRIESNAKVQEGDQLLESSETLLEQYEEVMDKMLDIIVKINRCF